MDIKLNDYFDRYLNDNAGVSNTHVVIYPNNATVASLVNLRKPEEAVLISIADCLQENAARLPMPNELWESIDVRISAYKSRVTVVGIDAYLALISEQNIKFFFVALKARIDEKKQNAIYLLSERYYSYIKETKYLENRTLFRIEGKADCLESPSAEVVSDRWVITHDNLIDYNSLMTRLGDFQPSGKHKLVLKDLTESQAGLSAAVTFLLDASRIAEQFYGITSDLDNATLDIWLARACKAGEEPVTYLTNSFGGDDIDPRHALKRLIGLPDDDLWPAYVWLLRKHLHPNSYLAKVLSGDVSHGNLLRKYVIDTLASMLNNLDVGKFADERKGALADISAEPLIIDFIGQTDEIDAAAMFLNCGTKAERLEVIRRVSKLDLVTGLPELYQELYPALADYLSVDYDFGNENLTAYFKDYRKSKIRNEISEEFTQRAFEIELPDACPTRDSMLADLRADDGTALLIVDGMGAEYFPLILSMAKRENMGIESCAVASVKLPTSTDFNKVMWDPSRIIKQPKAIDNTAHDGAEKNEENPPERNIDKALQTFGEVFNCVAAGLSQFNRVVVTADHGTSKLAVLAHEAGFSKDLPWEGDPIDWRYSLAPANAERPSAFEKKYHPDRNDGNGETYWIVRGYNRLPKKGGKKNELHGGATLEERLVPVVIFSKAATAIPQKHTPQKAVAQIADRFGFDEI